MDLASQFNGLLDSPEKALAAVNRVGPPVVTTVLVAAIAWLVASLTVTLLPRPETGLAPVSARQAAPAAPQAANVPVREIVNRHLFGQVDATPVAQEPEEGPAEVTRLPLTLVGTVAAANEDRSLAIIEQGGEAKVYAIGDAIQQRVTLQSVEAKAVYLSNNGRREVLELPREDGASAAPAGRSSATRRSSASRRRAAATPAPAKPAVVAESSQRLGDFIRPQPVFANGKQRGYRVYPGRQRDQFTALGLKAGDLVTEINGTPLDDPARGLEVFRSIAGASQVSVTIERNGSPTSLVLDTSQLNLDGADR